MDRKYKMLCRFLEHDLIKEKYQIETIPKNFHEAEKSDELIISLIAVFVKEIERGTVDAKSLYTKTTQIVNLQKPDYVS